MHPDLANLLGALRAQPDDELAHLALADWCQEQPDEATQARGDYLRLSLEHRKLSARADAARDDQALQNARATLRGRAYMLERQHSVAWFGTIPDMAESCSIMPGGRLKVELSGRRVKRARRGNVQPVSRALAVWVSTLAIKTAPAREMRWLAEALPATCVRTLMLAGRPGPDFVQALARAPWLLGLLELRLHTYSKTRVPVDVTRLANHRGLASLEELHLTDATFDAKGCAGLANSPHLRAVRSLTLLRCGLGVGHIRALRAFGQLNHLALNNNLIDAEGARALVDWPGLAGAQNLVLSNNPIRDAGAEALARSPQLRELRNLELASCGLSDEGLKALASSSFRKLESLDVRGSPAIGDAGLLAVCRSASLPALRRFYHDWRLGQSTRDALRQRFGT
jgi:uncharacterized protein (TIGR02996 family)